MVDQAKASVVDTKKSGMVDDSDAKSKEQIVYVVLTEESWAGVFIDAKYVQVCQRLADAEVVAANIKQLSGLDVFILPTKLQK